MHVGVEEVAHHKAGEPGVQRGDQGAGRVVRVAPQHLQIGERHAVEALHGEHPLGGVRGHRARRHRGHIAGFGEEAVERVQIASLLQEIALFEHARLQLLDHTGERRAGQPRRQRLDQARRRIEKVEIGEQHLAHARTLDLDHHVGAVFQAGGVHLGDGGAGQRLGIDPFIQGVQGRAELRFHGLTDVMERQRRRAIQALLEFADVFLREQRRRTGDELAQLDVGGAQGFKGTAQVAGQRFTVAQQPAQALAADHAHRFEYTERAAGGVAHQGQALPLTGKVCAHFINDGVFAHHIYLEFR